MKAGCSDSAVPVIVRRHSEKVEMLRSVEQPLTRCSTCLLKSVCYPSFTVLANFTNSNVSAATPKTKFKLDSGGGEAQTSFKF